MKKATLFKNVERNSIHNTNEIVADDWWSVTSNSTNSTQEVQISENIKITWSTSLWGKQTSWVNNSNNKNKTNASNSVSLSNTNTKTLSGTTEYFGTLDIVSILGQNPKFTLQDSRWNYFVYYWEHLDFAQTIKALWWSIYEMVTEAEILQNQLFGERVSYINLSMFKDNRVLMVIEIDGDVWLLQIPADKYHQSKDYLKSLFIQ